MLEMMIAAGGKVGDIYPGPGGKVLVNGDKKYGYCGFVSIADGMPSQADLTSAAGLSALGSAYTPTASGLPYGYLKFVMDGKVLYMPKYPVRRGLSWNQLYNAGLVYGDGTMGKFPTATPTLQNKSVQVTDSATGKVWTLKMRLARFVDDDPYGSVTPITSDKAEFEHLLLPLMKSGADRWGNWFFNTLGWDNSVYTWTLTTYLTTNAWQRQIDSTGAVLNKLPTKTTGGTNDVWWPVLELSAE